MGRVYVWRRSTATALERPWQLTWSELDAMQPNATEIAVGEAGIMVSPAQPAAPAAAGAAGHCQAHHACLSALYSRCIAQLAARQTPHVRA